MRVHVFGWVKPAKAHHQKEVLSSASVLYAAESELNVRSFCCSRAYGDGRCFHPRTRLCIGRTDAGERTSCSRCCCDAQRSACTCASPFAGTAGLTAMAS